jgi:hypothetical protein
LDKLVLLFYNHITNRTLTKQKFGKIFTEARDKAVTTANMKTGLLSPGIYPFNSSIITDELLLPSLVAKYKGAQVSNVVTLIEMQAHAFLPQKS